MITYFILIILSIFSTGIMSYISMATPIGPWIGPTLVIFSTILFSFFSKQLSSQNKIIFTVIGGSIGGILSTALGFSLPTLFFLDSELFASWLQKPFYFSCVVSALSLVAALFGFWIANVLENKLIVEDKLSFPVGNMIHKMIMAQNHAQQAKQLVVGFFSTLFFCIVQAGIFGFKNIIPKAITLTKSTSFYFLKIPTLTIELFPTYWAIGFVTGHIIALPLVVGALSKIFVADVVNNVFFPNITNMSFMLAFCSGMILSGTILGLMDLPKFIWDSIKGLKSTGPMKLRSWLIPFPTFLKDYKINESIKKYISKEYFIHLILVLILNSLFFTYFNFSILAQIYLILFTFLCAYQVTGIAGKIGLAQLGRFATFVMVPAIFIFNLNFIQITLIATFVEICCGVATDVLFGRKVAHLSNISSVKRYQLIGIVVSSLAVGFIFWLLINHFTLGSSALFAQRAQARALLINAVSFNQYVLIIGFVFGLLLKKSKINPMMVLGGLLMPMDISIGLIIGSSISYICKNSEHWYPFWSGVFASHSIWILFQAVKGIVSI